ncbi:glycoside hydrolase family 9 protein [Caldicellulosiruptor acetigenus]|uniref:Endoglucanase n=1 Tax=Caldicellulosiruptor acetigenus 6A TaxID=632516 RepID=G2PY45_9FIRM|nr:glycoside hydrolase family 9 protein [Caldicellulosiruptor acetigenus]AEM74912.1 glycoside hydrolase family 9 [Caldicellulosiruptor acetigenus 6A]
MKTARLLVCFVLVCFILTTTILLDNNKGEAAMYNYGEALQKAIMFYEFQMSGKLPKWIRNNWRGDSGLNDGKDNKIDLTGGWYDAGDHVKFNLPMSYTATMLAWAVYEYKDAFVKSGQLQHILNQIEWVNDYFVKCHPEKYVYYYQVGDGGKDHAWWGPAEVMPMERPSYKVTKTNPGSTVVAETAAALAAGSIVIKQRNSKKARIYLKHAKELYDFAAETKSDAGYTAANGYYNSWSGFWDELSWAAVWLYLATGDKYYLSEAKKYVSNWPKIAGSNTIDYRWAHCWDDVHYGAALLLAKITDENTYKQIVEKHLDYWTIGYQGQRIKYTPKGLAWLDQWGSLRYATTTAFLAFVYSDWKGCPSSKKKVYRKFGEGQVNYALGSSGRSFVVGFGKNPPKRPHHRTAHGSWANSQSEPPYHRHILYGALVGGPGLDDSYSDDVGNYVNNEVACDYNAGFVGALAKMYLLYGGKPIPNFKAIEKPSNDEFFVEAGINASGSNFVEIKAIVYNQSGWPARVTNNLKFRYYINLSEIVSQGYKPSQISLNTNYNQGAKVSGPYVVDSKKHLYYILIDFSGTSVYPGGQDKYKKEVQFRIAAPQNARWDNSNDYSFKGLDKTGGGQVIKTKYIPLYDGKKLVWGIEPNTKNLTLRTSQIPANGDADKKSKTILSKNTSSAKTSSKQNKEVKNVVKVLYKNMEINKTSNSIRLYLKIINNSQETIDLSKVKIRYWYTADDGVMKQSAVCDWAQIGAVNVTFRFVRLRKAVAKADHYLEIGFTNNAGKLQPGKDSGDIQLRFNKSNWGNYDQSNDWSWVQSMTSYGENKKITLYIDGKLVWGQEPTKDT